MKKLMVAVFTMFLGSSYQALSQSNAHEEHHPSAGSSAPQKPKPKANKPMGMNSGQMMGDDCPMMKDPQMGEMHDLMHSGKVDVNVAEIDGGVIVKWSSADQEVAKKLQKMGKNIKSMHSAMAASPGKMHDGKMKE